MLLETG